MGNTALLDSVKNKWRRARKHKAIRCKRLHSDTKIDTLEGEVVGKAGGYICKGYKDELYPYDPEKLDKNYERVIGSFEKGGWYEFKPRKNTAGVLAVQMDKSFEVINPKGKLKGKAKDYLVKSYDDKDNEYPKDVWIVDKELFDATYKWVNNEK